MTPSPLDPVLLQVANAYGLPFDLFKAQAIHESSLEPTAFRYEPAFFTRYIVGNPAAKAARFGPLAAASYGLLQVMLEVASELGFDGYPWQLFDPQIGAAWGAKKMKALWRWAGGTDTDYVQALCAYNGGTVGNDTAPYRNLAYAQAVYRIAGKDL